MFKKRIAIKVDNATIPIFKKSLFLLADSIRNNFPVPYPTNIIPSQGIGGYPITKVLPEPNGNAPGMKKGINILFARDFSAKGISGIRACPKIIRSPIIAIILGLIFSKKANVIKPKPIAESTSKRNTLKWISNHKPKLTSVKSKMINHIPLENKNLLLSAMFFLFLNEIKAEVPDRKTNVGAHR